MGVKVEKSCPSTRYLSFNGSKSPLGDKTAKSFGISQINSLFKLSRYRLLLIGAVSLPSEIVTSKSAPNLWKRRLIEHRQKHFWF